MRHRRHLCLMLFAAAVLATCGTSEAQSSKVPNPEVLKRVLDKKLQLLKPGGMTERNVLFQTVVAGMRDGGSFPFRVTLLIRDYGPGYPTNRYYGETCVSQITDGVYTLSPDAFGEWQVQGRMTPDLSHTACKPNPSAGVSSAPLASLAGSPAPTGAIGGPAAGSATGAVGSAARSPAAVAVGGYECWANGQARMLMNFTIRDASRYTGSDGATGTFSFDAATTRITFKGGALDGVMPAGFYAIYHSVQGRSKVSFMGPGGAEATFCDRS